jgi:hypothetical protein
VNQSKRKDIYAYLHQLVKELQLLCDKESAMKRLLSDCEPSWTALRKAREEEEESYSSNWGERVLPQYINPAEGRAPDIVRRHEEQKAGGINMMDKGATSTTRKIIQTSVQSRIKMMGFDDALK